MTAISKVRKVPDVSIGQFNASLNVWQISEEISLNNDLVLALGLWFEGQFPGGPTADEGIKSVLNHQTSFEALRWYLVNTNLSIGYFGSFKSIFKLLFRTVESAYGEVNPKIAELLAIACVRINRDLKFHTVTMYSKLFQKRSEFAETSLTNCAPTGNHQQFTTKVTYLYLSKLSIRAFELICDNSQNARDQFAKTYIEEFNKVWIEDTKVNDLLVSNQKLLFNLLKLNSNDTLSIELPIFMLSEYCNYSVLAEASFNASQVRKIKHKWCRSCLYYGLKSKNKVFKTAAILELAANRDSDDYLRLPFSLDIDSLRLFLANCDLDSRGILQDYLEHNFNARLIVYQYFKGLISLEGCTEIEVLTFLLLLSTSSKGYYGSTQEPYLDQYERSYALGMVEISDYDSLTILYSQATKLLLKSDALTNAFCATLINGSKWFNGRISYIAAIDSIKLCLASDVSNTELSNCEKLVNCVIQNAYSSLEPNARYRLLSNKLRSKLPLKSEYIKKLDDLNSAEFKSLQIGLSCLYFLSMGQDPTWVYLGSAEEKPPVNEFFDWLTLHEDVSVALLKFISDEKLAEHLSYEQCFGILVVLANAKSINSNDVFLLFIELVKKLTLRRQWVRIEQSGERGMVTDIRNTLGGNQYIIQTTFPDVGWIKPIEQVLRDNEFYLTEHTELSSLKETLLEKLVSNTLLMSLINKALVDDEVFNDHPSIQKLLICSLFAAQFEHVVRNNLQPSNDLVLAFHQRGSELSIDDFSKFLINDALLKAICRGKKSKLSAEQILFLLLSDDADNREILQSTRTELLEEIFQSDWLEELLIVVQQEKFYKDNLLLLTSLNLDISLLRLVFYSNISIFQKMLLSNDSNQIDSYLALIDEIGVQPDLFVFMQESENPKLYDFATKYLLQIESTSEFESKVLAMCDSPLLSVRRRGLRLLDQNIKRVDYPNFLSKLSQHPSPDVWQFVLDAIPSLGSVDKSILFSSVLHSRGIARKSKEQLKTYIRESERFEEFREDLLRLLTCSTLTEFEFALQELAKHNAGAEEILIESVWETK